MIKTLNTILDIRGASGANRLIYYLQRLPVIGKMAKNDLYSRTGLKKTLTVIVLILKIIWGFLTKFAYLGIVVYWPVITIGKELPPAEQYQLYLQVLVIISCVVAAVSNAVILEPKRDKYICVKLMRLPADQYMHATLSLRTFSFFVYYIPAMCLFASLLQVPVWQGVLLALLLTAWRLGSEALHLWLFDRTDIVLVKKTGWVWTVIGVGFPLAYALLYAEVSFVDSAMLFNLPAGLAIAAIGVVAAVYIARYPRYRSAVDAVTKIDDPLLDMGRMMKESRVKDVETKEKDFSAEQLSPGQFQEKSGYAYLNAIFFSRHKRFLIQPIQRRLLIIGVLFAAGLLSMMVSPAMFTKMSHFLIGSLSYFVFIMNFTSIGEKVCKAMFYNCDISLLRYGFYRERTAVLSNFRIRLLRITALNLIPAGAICIAVNLLILLSDETWGIADAAGFCGAILGLSLFFSVHHLFMYYIFQPYSTELNLKNPFFTIVNSIVLAATIVCLRLESTPAYFAGMVLLTTVAYMTIALFLVYKYSGRTFRVK
ncbi:hypothetical protein H70357_09630 [Paenibacillus sp. FSL H7-0357]|uniref:hypothetical protein n=1 Tax=Paenibacillus sp. FSL H7-0357 TaxID=1536774 RepID=UPI0004F5E647|nr:hypothetical protein [Paenibacillus sp. FSL H7-0357]AIQ16894.1 hypothetical protein H70357_09630 [Paenibacillus sp. FSL H7-0357]